MTYFSRDPAYSTRYETIQKRFIGNFIQTPAFLIGRKLTHTPVEAG